MLLKHQLKNWCFWTVVLEKTLESPLDCKEIQPVHSKGNQSWVFIGRNDAEAETPILWPPDVKSWLIGKDPDAGKRLKVGGEGDDRGWDVGWHHRLTGHEFEWTGSWWWTGRPGVLRSLGPLLLWSRMLLCDWTELRTNCVNALKNDSFLFFSRIYPPGQLVELRMGSLCPQPREPAQLR